MVMTVRVSPDIVMNDGGGVADVKDKAVIRHPSILAPLALTNLWRKAGTEHLRHGNYSIKILVAFFSSGVRWSGCGACGWRCIISGLFRYCCRYSGSICWSCGVGRRLNVSCILLGGILSLPSGAKHELVEAHVAEVSLDAVQQVDVADLAVGGDLLDDVTHLVTAVCRLGCAQQVAAHAWQPHAPQEDEIAAGDEDEHDEPQPQQQEHLLVQLHDGQVATEFLRTLVGQLVLLGQLTDGEGREGLRHVVREEARVTGERVSAEAVADEAALQDEVQVLHGEQVHGQGQHVDAQILPVEAVVRLEVEDEVPRRPFH
ncbi:hypothetical protein E2C01_009116 [Portunus trituberculatus]|uniref:Uncharacterized protein n=1 Tax=Portunus trituberculatus TaxID=210409 RepID=A0A5B7D573_PORTR|nr:hypothetical protein [Portunus trituberculatus]